MGAWVQAGDFVTAYGMLKGYESIPSCTVLALGVVALKPSDKTWQVTVSVKVFVIAGTVE